MNISGIAARACAGLVLVLASCSSTVTPTPTPPVETDAAVPASERPSAALGLSDVSVLVPIPESPAAKGAAEIGESHE